MLLAVVVVVLVRNRRKTHRSHQATLVRDDPQPMMLNPAYRGTSVNEAACEPVRLVHSSGSTVLNPNDYLQPVALSSDYTESSDCLSKNGYVVPMDLGNAMLTNPNPNCSVPTANEYMTPLRAYDVPCSDKAYYSTVGGDAHKNNGSLEYSLFMSGEQTGPRSSIDKSTASSTYDATHQGHSAPIYNLAGYSSTNEVLVCNSQRQEHSSVVYDLAGRSSTREEIVPRCANRNEGKTKSALVSSGYDTPCVSVPQGVPLCSVPSRDNIESTIYEIPCESGGTVVVSQRTASEAVADAEYNLQPSSESAPSPVYEIPSDCGGTVIVSQHTGSEAAYKVFKSINLSRREDKDAHYYSTALDLRGVENDQMV